jgi:dienelactone hydrolase
MTPERPEPAAPVTGLTRRRLLTLSALTAAAAGLDLAPAAAAPRARASGPLRAAAAPAVPRLTLPAPTGGQAIGTVPLHLVDRSRQDPWAPTPRPRELMVQLWYPCRQPHDWPAAPWIAPGAAPHFEESWNIPPGSVRLPTTSGRTGAPAAGRRPYPVLLYSPGYGLDRNSSTSLVQELAAHGYLVVTIDHTYEASEIEFPGGRLVTALLPADPSDRLDIQETGVREADARFVLDRIEELNTGGNPDAEHRPLPRGLRGAFDLDRTGMFGHSLGGCTAAAVMHDDPRVKAGLSLDGPFIGPSAPAGSDRPFLLLSSDHDDPYPGWDAFWANQRGPKLELRLLGSTHGSFTDGEVLVPELAPVLGLTPSQVVDQIGTGAPQRSIAVQRAYLRAFFDRYLRHGDGALLRGPSPRYPEMRFVR